MKTAVKHLSLHHFWLCYLAFEKQEGFRRQNKTQKLVSKNNKNLPSSPGVIYVIYRADVLGTESIHFIFIPKREIIGFLTERHNHTDVF